MKLFGKFLIAALVLAFLLPFTILKGKDGRPLMSFSNIKLPSVSLPEVPDSIAVPKAAPVSGAKDIIYQWRDEKGALNFTSAPPPEGINYSVKGYDPNMNLIQSVKVQAEEAEPVAAETPIQKPLDIGNPYSPGKVEKLIEDAQNVQKLLDDRLKKQEAMLGQ